MADNLNITSGAGVTIGTDDISDVHYQRVKLVDGTLGSTNAVGVSASPLFVKLNEPTVQISGGITLLSSGSLSVNATVLNTGLNATILNTGAYNVTILNSGAYNATILNTGLNATILNTVSSVIVSGTVTSVVTGSVTSLITGGVTLLTASSLINVIVTGGVTLLTASSLINVIVSGGVTLLTASSLLNTIVTGSVTSLVTGTVTSLVTGGVSILSGAYATVKQGVRNYEGCTSTWVYAALSSNNQTVVWKPAATKKFNITDLTLSVKSAATVTITQDTAATLTIMKLNLMDRGGWVSNFQTPIIASDTSHALVVTTTESGTNSYIIVTGYES